MAPVYEWGHNTGISVNLIYKQNKNILMMKTDKGKEALRRIRKCIYYTVYLFTTGVFALCSCMNMNNLDDNADPPALAPLEGTAWKLAGFVDAETGVLTELDGTDCEKCYKLAFATDADAEGWSMLNQFWIRFWEPIQISSTNISFSKQPRSCGTEVGEPPTPTRYKKALADLTSYIYYNDELKLFYNNNRNYLLYKFTEQ
jgi:hypothetical protein